MSADSEATPTPEFDTSRSTKTREEVRAEVDRARDAGENIAAGEATPTPELDAEAVLTPHLGDTVARQVSTLLLLVLLAGWFWLIHQRWPLSSARQAWLVGALWLAMTLAFETVMGRVLGDKTWPQVFEDYDVLAGRIWTLVPLFTSVGPYVFFRATARRGRSR